jgi:glucosyl-dolichyl phosphate glucuronosyltransferase
MRTQAIVIPTYNRARSLERTLNSLAVQDVPVRPEIIVVDNNSTDDTAHVVAAHPNVLYIKEPRQGLSFARNTGIDAARHLAPDDVVAFVDDDVEPTPGWSAALRRAFGQHPDASCIGGRVLPLRPERFPRWLTTDHWAPLALQDHGAAPLVFDAADQRGLVGANFAFRRRVFDEVGLFSPAVQRVKDGIGSTEDHEFLRRLYAAGHRAVYVPDVVVTTDVPAERMTFGYHRRWHRGHGRFHARMHMPGMGAPYIARAAAADAWRWLRMSAAGDAARAFEAEAHLWFFSGFLEERCACAARR